MALLEFEDVHVTYRSREGDVPAVRGVSLTVEALSLIHISEPTRPY